MDHSSIDKQTYIQQLLSGRKRVLLTSAASQRSLPFDHSVERFQHSCGDAGDEFVARMLSDLRALEAKRKMTELAAIRRALSRIEGGTCETCEHCGMEIADDHPKARPTATHGVDSQAARQRTYR
ncbi:MAG TPA: hypothetical protein VFB75_23315 [Burkholderiales bacterium]|nr:hypothetical protein [Burkholderiales bacterium]